MPPHTHRPPPSAITRVCKTSIAFVKKSINLIPFFGVELLLKVVCGQFVHLERLVRLHDGRSAFHVPSHIKEILFVGVGGVLVVGVPGQVVLVREEGAHAPQHEDTLAAVHYRQFVLGHQLFATMSSDEFKEASLFHKKRTEVPYRLLPSSCHTPTST